MAHRLTAVVAAPALLERLSAAARGPAPVALAPGLAIAALGEQQIDVLTALRPGAYVDGFTYLSAALARALAAFSLDGPLAYIETDYAGGRGSQAAASFREGEMVGGASQGGSARDPGSPIDAALRALGVVARPGRDAFDSLGLGRFRTMAQLGVPDDD